MSYNGRERRVRRLSENEFDEIASRAAEKALDKVYSDIGKGVLKRLLWLFGIGSSGLVIYLTSKGYIK